MADGMPPPKCAAGGLSVPRGRPGRRRGGDAGVIKTNDDAQATKLSCASLGYFSDPLLPALARVLPSRKPPLINRGTWARHAAIRQVTADFAAACVAAAAGDSASSSSSQPVCQVVALGAGSDSAWFNLRHAAWPHAQAVRYVELDHAEVVSRKARTILATPALLQLLPNGTAASMPQHTAAAAAASSLVPAWTKAAEARSLGGDGQSSSSGPQPPPEVLAHAQELCGPLYSLVAADLRDLAACEAAMARAGCDPGLPTLYLAECVLVYLEPGEARALLAMAAARAARGGAAAAVAIYEQTRPGDAFGQTMLQNLEARGCPLRSLLSVPTPGSQAKRLLSAGWTFAAAADMAALYYGQQPTPPGARRSTASQQQQQPVQPGGWLRPTWQAERARIERLELLDELEEWQLLQEHYLLALGVLGDGPSGWLAHALQLQQLAQLGRDSGSEPSVG